MRARTALAVAILAASPISEAQRATCFYGTSTTTGAPNPTIFARFSYSIQGEQSITFRMSSLVGGAPGAYSSCGNIGGACVPDDFDYVYGMRLIPFIDYSLIAPPYPGSYWGSFESIGGVFYTPTLEERKPGQTGQYFKVLGYRASCQISRPGYPVTPY